MQAPAKSSALGCCLLQPTVCSQGRDVSLYCCHQSDVLGCMARAPRRILFPRCQRAQLPHQTPVLPSSCSAGAPPWGSSSRVPAGTRVSSTTGSTGQCAVQPWHPRCRPAPSAPTGPGNAPLPFHCGAQSQQGLEHWGQQETSPRSHQERKKPPPRKPTAKRIRKADPTTGERGRAFCWGTAEPCEPSGLADARVLEPRARPQGRGHHRVSLCRAGG